jgi:hypothetical protein
MAWVAIVVMVVAAAYAAYSQREQAKSQQEYYDYQAKVQEFNAKLAEQNAAAAARVHRRKVMAILSSQRARLSAAGLDISMGSPLELFAETAYEGEMDAQRILYKGKMEGMGFQMSAALSTFQGDAALKGGTRQAYGTLLTGAAQASSAGVTAYGGGGATTGNGSVSAETQASSPNQGYGGGEGGARGA